MPPTLSRRTVLRLGSAGCVLLASRLLTSCAAPAAQTPAAPDAAGVAAPRLAPAPQPKLELSIRAAAVERNVLPGAATAVWAYELTAPAGGDVAASQGTIPIIRARRGQEVRISFANALPDPEAATVIHWHGLHVPPAMNGDPHNAVAPGGTLEYSFTVANRAGTYWFHPHAHGSSARQLYQGLVGLFLVADDEEAALGLPTGEQDIALVIQDQTFDAANQLVYGGGMAMHTALHGFLGERAVVNGRADASFDLATRAYRLRLLNASNSRIYKLAWGDGTPLTVIANDGGLLAAPVTRPFVVLAPGERVELWADLRGRAVGSELALVSQAVGGVGMTNIGGGGHNHGATSAPAGSATAGSTAVAHDHSAMATPAPGATGAPTAAAAQGGASGGMGGMGGMGEMGGMSGEMGGMCGGEMGGMCGAMGDAGGELAALDILRIRIVRAEEETLALPERLGTIERHRLEDAVNKDQRRQIALTMGHMQWLINGRTYEMGVVAPDEVVKLNALELWEISNDGAPGANAMVAQLTMAHPFHIHGGQFQIVGRQVSAAGDAAWRALSDGFVDGGWKDTVLVMPGERVRFLMRFTDFTGDYPYHCHTMEHADGGMMRMIRIEA